MANGNDRTAAALATLTIAAAGRPRRSREKRVCNRKKRHKVDYDRREMAIEGDALELAAIDDAGVVDQNVDRPGLGTQSIANCKDLAEFGHIHRIAEGVADFGNHSFNALRVAIRDNNRGARTSEFMSHRPGPGRCRHG